MGAKSLLLVDDDPKWLRLLERLFARCGYSVTTAGSCAAALRALLTMRPHCVILDYNLSDGKAHSVCAGLGRRTEPGRPAVIILTSDPEGAVCLEGEHAADLVVLKGEPLSDLLDRVEFLLSRDS
ncbi:MAG: response regulator [Elusimicrobiales bacterium]|nr:response regulator [Elusimicrobiales bacterium]